MKLRFLEHQVVRFLQERCYLGDQLSTRARQQMQQRHLQPFLKKIVAGVVVVAMLMAVMGASLYRDTTSLIQTSQQVIHTQNFIQKLEILLSKLTDAEIGQRGYIITGKDNYLQPYYVAAKQIEREVTILRESVADDPNQQQRLNTLESLLISKLTELKTTINLRRHQGVEAALQVVQTDRGKNLMDAVREVIHQMESAENNLLRQCLLSLEANARYTIFTLSTGIVITFFISLGICYLIYQEVIEHQQAEEQLQRSEQRYRFLADVMPQIVWTARPDGYLDYYNNRWYEFTGFTKGEEGDDRWKLILHPDDVEVCFNRWESSVRTGVAYKLEYRLFDCKTGSYRWHLGEALPMRNENGDIIQWIGTSTDINDQRLALEELATAHQQLDLKVQERTAELVEEVNERIRIEEQLQASLAAAAAAAQEKELLLKEIHHRVKNNLQIVSGLLYLQSRYVNDLPTLTLLKENRDRIQSMALIHEKLYGSKNLGKIDFKDYTQSLIQNLYISQSVNTNLISFKVDIEPLYLGIDTAIHCGLIINELVSNSLKHAFPSGLSGEITIQFYTTKERNFELIVRDNGVGFVKQPDFQQQKSLGLRLVHALATKQLEGTLELTKGKAASVTPESNSGCVFRTSPQATSGWKEALNPRSSSISSPGAEFRICFSV